MKSLTSLVAAVVTVALTVGVSTARAQTPQKISVSSSSLREGEPVPVQHTPYGRNDSPSLMWTNVPASAKELVIICEDPDAGNPPPFVHWVIYKVPATANGLPEALPLSALTPMPAELAGAVQGLSGFRRPTYRGPAPPMGSGVHHYHFVVHALDIALPAPGPMQPPMTRAELLDAMKGHVVGRGELVALYERK